MRSKKRGFTLVELMIVVGLIALLAVISIPNIYRAKLNANETAAIASLKTMSTAMESYAFSQTPSSYIGASLTALSNTTPAYIDQAIGSGQKQGYRFLLQVSGADRYYCYAIPLRYRQSGSRYFIYSSYSIGAIQPGVIYAYDFTNPGWRPVG